MTGIADAGKQSVRKLAEQIGRSKSGTHRHLKAINKRDHHRGKLRPEVLG